MVVFVTIHPDAVPGVLLDLDAGAVNWVDIVDEVPAECQRELLDLADVRLFRVRVDGVLLGVGWQDT